ncbi:DUF6470 family protein [Paenibacillus hamazuiensis]|uniref:DUF6470 family protein n=1 Tax=Paenibacillus hamazuiensis TaxID=2936508 RepID=UPI002010685B
MNIPRIQIHQQFAQIGIDAELGQQSIKQPQATLDMNIELPKVQIDAEDGKLSIDQSKAFEGLGHGPFLQVMSQLYTRSANIGLQGIAKIVADGNRMAQITNPTNAFAELAKNAAFDSLEYRPLGTPSYDNVDVHYEPGPLDINLQQGSINLQTHPNRPEYHYYRGKFDVYLLQKADIDIIPPRISERI